jgi:hypothetical protein
MCATWRRRRWVRVRGRVRVRVRARVRARARARARRTMATAEVGCSESIERSSESGSKQHTVNPSSSSSESRA